MYWGCWTRPSRAVHAHQRGSSLRPGPGSTTPTTASERLLPQGVAAGCTILRDLPKDHVLTYDDVELPAGREIDALRAEQAEMFGPA